MGIGLTLVKRLVEMHGGRVEAFSAGPGQGSEFVVRLPLAKEFEPVARAAEPAGPGPAAKAAGRRILVVDDSRDSAETLQVLLELLGHEVRSAHDGPSALQAAVAFRPQVAFLDIGMPGMNGHEVARKLRRMTETKDVVLVAQTGWGQEEDRRRSAEAGFDHHLVKPVDLSAIEGILKLIK